MSGFTTPATGGFTALASSSTAGLMSPSAFTKVDYWVNVLDYGADPTGAADSWQAFTDAVAAIPIGSQRYGILVPPGLYVLSKTWMITRPVRIMGGSSRAAAAGGSQILGRKGFDVIRVQYTNTVIAGGGAGSIIEGLAVNHQSGTGSWVANQPGYLANQSAVIPTTGYNGHWDNYITGSGNEPFVLRCIKDGTAGATEPTWSSHGFGIVIERGQMSRVSNVVTVTTLTAHGKSTGNSVYILSEDPAFASGFYTITVDDSDTFHYTETGTNATNGSPCKLADVISDNTTAWIKVYVAGIKLEASCTIRECSAGGIGGDGIAVYATVGGGYANNANGFKIEHCTLSSNIGWGLVTRESDANGGIVANCFAIVNGWGGFLENSSLGNLLTNCGAENNGLGKISVGVGPGIVVPALPATNNSTIVGSYMEGGQRCLIGASAFFVQSTSGSGVYGSGTVLGSQRCSQLIFQNDTNDDGTGNSVTARIGQPGTLKVLNFAYSQDSNNDNGYTLGVINGSGADATGWVSMGGPTLSNYAQSLALSAEGAGHFWVPNRLYRGTSGTGRLRSEVIGFSAPTSGTWATGDKVYCTRPDITGGVFEYKCISGGTPGTWAPVFAKRHQDVSSDGTVVFGYVSDIALTATVNNFQIDQPTSNYPDGTMMTVRDANGTCGASPCTITVYNGGTINGDTAGYTLSQAYGTVVFVVRGGQWYVQEATKPFHEHVAVRTTALTLTRAHLGTTFQNTGATAKVVLTLPASPQIGDYYSAYVDDTDGIQFLAQGSQTIRVVGTVSGAAGYTESTTQGSFITLKYLKSNYWVAIASLGTWTTV